MTARSATRRTLLLGSLAAPLAAQAAVAASAARPPEREVRTVVTPAGESVAYELGTFFVPENRANPASRTIGVGYARLRSTGPNDGPPTFHLPGGPGESYLDVFTEDSDWARRKLAELLRYRAIGDVVLVDQRGYSRRGELLKFVERPKGRPLDRPAALADETAVFVAAAKAAVAAHPDKDLSGYTVIQCVADVDDLRQALGYDRINLVGQSFGSQWSFAVMRLRPQIVARALLSGVEPLDNGYDMPGQVFAALQRLSWEADQDPGLAPYLPPGGLMAAVRAVHDRFVRGSIKVVVGRQAVVLGLEDFRQGLLRPAEAWPAFVLSLYHRRYDAWAREVIKSRTEGESDEALIGPLIDTSLGVTAAREHLLRTDPAVEFLGWWNFDSYIASAAVWPTPDIGDAVRVPAACQVPVVFVSGDWDISTPIENMLNMLPFFPNSRAVVVHRGGHGARGALAVQHPEVLDAILGFLRTGDAANLPSTVSLAPLAFARPSFPPPGRGA